MSLVTANNVDLDSTIEKMFTIVRKAGIKYEHDFEETTMIWDGKEVKTEIYHFEHDDVRINLDYIPDGKGSGESILTAYLEDHLLFEYNRTTNMIKYYNVDWMFLIDHLYDMIPKLQKERNKKLKEFDNKYKKELKKVQ